MTTPIALIHDESDRYPSSLRPYGKTMDNTEANVPGENLTKTRLEYETVKQRHIYHAPDEASWHCVVIYRRRATSSPQNLIP